MDYLLWWVGANGEPVFNLILLFVVDQPTQSQQALCQVFMYTYAGSAYRGTAIMFVLTRAPMARCLCAPKCTYLWL